MLAESTVRRRMQALEARGVIRQGDQTEARKIPANRRPVVYDLQVPLSFFRAEKRYDGGEAELSVNIWRAGRGRAPLTPQDRPDLASAPERKSREKGADVGVSEGHPKPGVSGDSPRGFTQTPPGVSRGHPTLSLTLPRTLGAVPRAARLLLTPWRHRAAASPPVTREAATTLLLHRKHRPHVPALRAAHPRRSSPGPDSTLPQRAGSGRGSSWQPTRPTRTA